jgi:hypothetical protein
MRDAPVAACAVKKAQAQQLQVRRYLPAFPAQGRVFARKISIYQRSTYGVSSFVSQQAFSATEAITVDIFYEPNSHAAVGTADVPNDDGQPSDART